MQRREGLVYLAAGFLIAYTVRRLTILTAFLLGAGLGAAIVHYM